MIDPRGNNLIFLLSVPRSGSSLSTVMLQNHSKVFATQEMWFLMSLHDLRKNSYRPYGGTAIINQFYNGILTEELFDQSCRAFALQVYNGLLSSSDGARMVVDKSPRYYYMLEFLDGLFPHSRRIFLIRNPFSIIASYKKVNTHMNDRFNLIQDLRSPKFNIKMADITIGLLRYISYFSGDSPYACRLRYEQLASRPQAEMMRLCEFLGLDYEEGVEKYSEHMNTAKAELFYSMGVGDPFLSKHNEPHLESIHSWKETLDKQEIELYGRTLGARVFHELGYSEELAEAEKITGVKFDSAPDSELLERLTNQLAELSGVVWTPGYRLQDSAEHVAAEAAASLPASAGTGQPNALQLQITLRSLEKRLEKIAMEERRAKAKLKELNGKLSRIKSIIPFGNSLSRLASRYLIADGVRK